MWLDLFLSLRKQSLDRASSVSSPSLLSYLTVQLSNLLSLLCRISSALASSERLKPYGGGAGGASLRLFCPKKNKILNMNEFTHSYLGRRLVDKASPPSYLCHSDCFEWLPPAALPPSVHPCEVLKDLLCDLVHADRIRSILHERRCSLQTHKT